MANIVNLLLAPFLAAGAVSAADSPQKKESSQWNASTVLTLGDAYWARPGFFPTHKEGPVVQPEVNVTYDAKAYGQVSGYAWLNQNLASGLSKQGAHELDLGMIYISPPFIQIDKTQIGFSLHGAWWEYGIAGKLGESHPIIEPGIWLNRKLTEKASIDVKVSGLRLLGEGGNNGWMLDAKLAFPLKMSEKMTLEPTVSLTYLDGSGFYNSKEGTAHIRCILPFTYSFGKRYSATLGFRAQKGFNGKDDKLGGFLKVQKDF